jgi:hypothetical protein
MKTGIEKCKDQAENRFKRTLFLPKQSNIGTTSKH